jgi:amidase
MPGQEVMPSVCGPIGHSVDDLVLFVKSVLSQEPWFIDPKVSPIEWREDVFEATKSSKKLTFGVLRNDGVCTPHPPIQRGIERTVEALKSAGHEVRNRPRPPLSRGKLN